MARAPHAHPHYGLHQHSSHAQRLSDHVQPQGVLVPADRLWCQASRLFSGFSAC